MREVYEVFGEVLGILRAAKIPVVDWFLGGSRGAGVGRPDSDWDVCILVRKADLSSVERLLCDAGFADCDPGRNYDASVFRAFRRGVVNPLIFTAGKSFDDARRANEVCKALRLTRRDDRVAVHKVIRDGESADTQRDTTDVGAMLDRVGALSEAVSMAANAVRGCLEAERRRAANLLPEAPASTYTQARIDKLEEGLAILDAVVKGAPKCRTRL